MIFPYVLFLGRFHVFPQFTLKSNQTNHVGHPPCKKKTTTSQLAPVVHGVILHRRRKTKCSKNAMPSTTSMGRWVTNKHHQGKFRPSRETGPDSIAKPLVLKHGIFMNTAA